METKFLFTKKSEIAHKNFYYMAGLRQHAKGEFEKALEYFKKAAAQRDADAQYYLGVYYKNSIEVEQDFQKAVNYYQLAAYQGHSGAQNDLGVCYEYGYGVVENIEKAIKLYQSAAEQKNPAAQYHLGICYQHGKGVAKDLKEAVKYYQLAADQGQVEAQNNLGMCYEYGHGVAQNFEKALEYYRKAAIGYEAAEDNLKRLGDEMLQSNQNPNNDRNVFFSVEPKEKKVAETLPTQTIIPGSLNTSLTFFNNNSAQTEPASVSEEMATKNEHPVSWQSPNNNK